MTEKHVLALSSEVGIGSVGLSIARFAFAAHRVCLIALPTILFASRPDMGTVVRHEIPPITLDEQLEALQHDGLMDQLDGVITGYFSSAQQVEIVASRLQALRLQKPDVKILVDPIIGDFDTGFYVSLDVAQAVRDLLLPLADVITPNYYEFLWLVGPGTASALEHDASLPQEISMARMKLKCNKLPAEMVVITSCAINGADNYAEKGAEYPTISTALIGPDTLIEFKSRYHEHVPKGTGDVFAASLLSHLVTGCTISTGVDRAVRLVEKIADKTKDKNSIEPYLLFEI